MNLKIKKKEFQDFVLDNIKTFDLQACDMFVNLTDLIPDEMKKDIDFWKEIYQYIKNIDCNDEFFFSKRSGFRVALVQEICENVLFLS